MFNIISHQGNASQTHKLSICPQENGNNNNIWQIIANANKKLETDVGKLELLYTVSGNIKW